MKFRKSLEKIAEMPGREVKKAAGIRRILPGSVSLKLGRSILIAQKHSPTILFVGGVAGVVTTTVLACRATLKLEKVLEDAQTKIDAAKELHESKNPKYSESDYRHDMAYLYIRNTVTLTKLYGPSLILGVTSIAALTGSHQILTKRNVAISAAYAAVDKAFSEYRGRVVQELGEDKDREFRYSTEEKTIIDQKPDGKVDKTQVKHVGRPGGRSMYARFFHEGNKNWSPVPEYNLMFIRLQQQWLNDQLRTKGHVFLNEAYDELGLERTKEGQVVGWLWQAGSGDNYIDFGVWTDARLEQFHNFVVGRDKEILLDFNVDGVIYEKI